MTRWTALAMALGLVVAACTNQVIKPGDDGEGGAGGGNAGGSTGIGGAGGAIHTGGTMSSSSGSGGGTCMVPEYSDSCDEVPYFECGFDAYCEGSTIHASWHVHVMCPDSEEIIQDYTCTFDCGLDGACTADFVEWPNDGQELIEQMCLPVVSSSDS